MKSLVEYIVESTKFSSLVEYIREIFQRDNLHDYLVEMATIQQNVRLNKTNFNVAIHGPSTKDRENPHIHIYLTGDNSLKQFNFEISLVDIVCKDEINLIRMLDKTKRKKVDIKNRIECSWDGYGNMEEDFEKWLFDKCKKRGEYINNLDAIIYYYNEEGKYLSENYLLKYISERNLKVLSKYHKYFSDEDQKNFQLCFNVL